MSYLSFNNPPSVIVPNRTLDLPSPMPVPMPLGEGNKLLGNKPTVLPENNRPVEVGRNGVAFSAEAFSKLFDMFELVFKAMRDMLSGKKPSLEPTLFDKVLTTGQDAKVQVEADKRPQKNGLIADKPVAPGKDLKVLSDSKPAIPGADARVKLEGGKQSVVVPDITIMPKVAGTDSKVASDTVVRVNLDLNINNCHCPQDPRPTVPVRPHPRPSPMIDTHNRPDLVDRPTVFVNDKHIKPGLVPDRAVPEPHVHVRPEVLPRPTPAVPQHNPVPEPDLTSPGPGRGPDEIGRARGFSRRV
ncbi:hypothetical protein NHF41_16610 [Pseudomonas proteolytica]|nr:hypothetical protein [Pseudomonas proteolytica]USW98159.1 hypothetical protein NHF41_16610 [Pseudomonas proteolytica]